MLKLTRLGRWLAPFAIVAGITAAAAQSPSGKTETAIFAGGCFWCVEEAFEKVPGVVSAVSGYTGGSVANPSYEQVMSKSTGHAEAVQVTYDPARVGYQQLVDWFWQNIDPFDTKGQFCDKGSPYRHATYS
jgi:peptide-methionine (S)-S-oxide reductase